jgi:AcrR family transcriptional regulator
MPTPSGLDQRELHLPPLIERCFGDCNSVRYAEPMSTARDAYRKAMRADLLAAAQTVLDRKGLAGFTIRDVLAEAGVAPGTLYSYFEGGKDDLLGALAQEIVEERVLETSQGEHGTPAAVVLWAMLEDGFTRPSEEASLLADLRGRANSPGQIEMLRRLNRDLVAGGRPLFEQVRDAGELGVEDPDALAELLDIVWDGLARRAGSETFVTSYERVGVLMLDLVRSLQRPDDREARRR